jgi:hypothetical protein
MDVYIPTASEIIEDVENRIGILVKLINPQSDLLDEEWNQIVYYNELYKNQRKQPLNSMCPIWLG